MVMTSSSIHKFSAEPTNRSVQQEWGRGIVCVDVLRMEEQQHRKVTAANAGDEVEAVGAAATAGGNPVNLLL